MTIIVVPTEECDGRCKYCFEPEKQRAEGAGFTLDVKAIKKSLIEIWAGPYRGSDITFHGGESTLIPRKEFEDLAEFIFGFKGKVNIVTNGMHITDWMIDLFKKLKFYVGISCDGPPELNVLRGPNPDDPEVTAQYNKTLNQNIMKLRDAGISVSMMCILHKANAGDQEKLHLLKRWLLDLSDVGITQGRLNLMYGEADQKQYELSPTEATQVMAELYEFCMKHELWWNPFKEMRDNLIGEPREGQTVFSPYPCNFARCNIFNTRTISILPDGTIGNCDRTFGMGMNARSRAPGISGRYSALEQTQCVQCRYWVICGGGCPVEGAQNDWRNRSNFCEAIYNLYAIIEKDLRAEDPERELVADSGADRGRPVGVENAPHANEAHGNDPHGNDPHGDEGHGNEPHGDEPHQNIPHGNSSHYDAPDWKLDEDKLEWVKPDKEEAKEGKPSKSGLRKYTEAEV